MKHRILSVLTAVCVLLLGIGIALAGGSGTVQGDIKWDLADNGILTITGDGEIPDYSSPEKAPWHDLRGEIRQVIIKGEISRIGANAFADCPLLSKIVLTMALTSLGENSFSNCPNLYCCRFSDEAENYEPYEPGGSYDEDAPAIVAGDVNGDGVFDGSDVLRLMKWMSQEEDGEIQEKAADVNQDGTVDERDLLLMVRSLSGEDVVLQTPVPQDPEG